MKKSLIACTTAIVLSLAASSASVAAATDVKSFLGDAIQDGRAEIELCRLALKKSTNPAVQSFAQRMIEAHTSLNEEIERLAAQRQISLPDGVGIERKSTYLMMSALPAQTFEREFAKHNVSDHEKDVQAFQTEAQQAPDARIKQFASVGVITLKDHLEMSRQLQAQVK